jgi:hypothetical protein
LFLGERDFFLQENYWIHFFKELENNVFGFTFVPEIRSLFYFNFLKICIAKF